MVNDFEPIIHTFPNRDDIKIYPIADLHVGSAQFDDAAWRDFVDKIQGEVHSYIVIGGDMMDNGIKSSVTNCYEATMRPSEQKKYLAKTLEPIKDKILCGTSGNHENRTVRECDDNPLYDVFCKLDIEDVFRENACFMFLRFGTPEMSGKDRPTYSVMVTHGAGGGSMIGSGANKVERFGSAVDGLDLLVTGHTHRPLTFPVNKIVIDPQNNKVSYKSFKCVTATSWLDYGGYPIRKMLTPTARELQEIHIAGKRKEIRVLQ